MANNADVEFSYAVFGRETSNVLTSTYNVKTEGGIRDVLLKEYKEGYPMLDLLTHSALSCTNNMEVYV